MSWGEVLPAHEPPGISLSSTWAPRHFSLFYKFTCSWNIVHDGTKDIVYVDFQSINPPTNFLKITKVLPGRVCLVFWWRHPNGFGWRGTSGLWWTLTGAKTMLASSNTTLDLPSPWGCWYLDFSVGSPVMTCRSSIFPSSVLRTRHTPTGEIDKLLGCRTSLSTTLTPTIMLRCTFSSSVHWTLSRSVSMAILRGLRLPSQLSLVLWLESSLKIKSGVELYFLPSKVKIFQWYYWKLLVFDHYCIEISSWLNWKK